LVTKPPAKPPVNPIYVTIYCSAHSVVHGTPTKTLSESINPCKALYKTWHNIDIFWRCLIFMFVFNGSSAKPFSKSCQTRVKWCMGWFSVWASTEYAWSTKHKIQRIANEYFPTLSSYLRIV
jgi:hypothetical protein